MTQPEREMLFQAYPFSSLPRAVLEEALPSLVLAGLAEGQSLAGDGPGLVPAAVPDGAVLILARGAVELKSGELKAGTLLEGGIWGFEPRFGGPELAALALEESLILALPWAKFEALTAPAMVHSYFQRLSQARSLTLDQARDAAARSAGDPFLGLCIRDVGGQKPLFVDPTDSVAEAARRMAEADATFCLAGSPEAATGILTERDILKKVVAPGADARALRVGEVMSSPVIGVGEGELLFEGFSRLIRHNIRRLAVQDDQGRVLSVIGERDMLAAKGESPASLARDMAEAKTAQDLARSVDTLRKLAARGLSEGIPVDRMGRLVSELYDQLMIRAMDLAAMGLGAGNPGDGQAPFALLALGSEGRKEQCLGTDQDNALVFEDVEGTGGAGGGDSGLHFLALGQAMEELLLAAGVPPCPHGVMVSNSRWNMSLSAWKKDVDALFETGDEEALLRLSLLADLRLVKGEARLARDLRAHLARRAKSAPIILKYMAREALRFSPPVSFFNALVVEKSGERKGALDIKKGGVFPLTQGIKTLALDLGLAETSTPERLRLLTAQGVFSAGTAQALAEAWDLFQSLRARFQVRAWRSGAVMDNFVQPDRLSAREREGLKSAFKVVADFQSLLFNRYGLRLLT